MYSVKRYLNRLTLTEPLTSTLCSVPPSGSARIKRIGGFPHSEIVGSKVAHTSPTLIAACHVLHRLYMPRHPRIALTSRLRAHTTTINAGRPEGHRLGRAARCGSLVWSLNTQPDIVNCQPVRVAWALPPSLYFQSRHLHGIDFKNPFTMSKMRCS